MDVDINAGLEKLKKEGTTSTFEIDLNVNVDKFWDVISNWKDVSWVNNIKESIELEPLHGYINRRIVKANGDTIDEILHTNDKTNHHLVYYVYSPGSMPVKNYMGEVFLKANENGTCHVKYQATYIVNDDIQVNVFKELFEKGFKENNIPFIQGKFN